MESAPFLHAAHQVRQAFDGLRAVSWLAIGLIAGAVIVFRGRLVSWVRTPEARAPLLTRWGQDGAGWYFELAAPADGEWRVETANGVVALTHADDGLLRPPAGQVAQPVALLAPDGSRLRL